MNCITENCSNVRSNRSKKGYCVECGKKAREAFKLMLAEQDRGKQEKIAAHESLWQKAIEAGREAGENKNPVPMIVEQHVSPFDDNSPVEKSYYVPEGVCGFAWISVKPGNSSFANWLKKNELARKDSYAGGVRIWISEYGQSMEKKEAHARAMAQVFNEAGIKAFAMSRMD